MTILICLNQELWLVCNEMHIFKHIFLRFVINTLDTFIVQVLFWCLIIAFSSNGFVSKKIYLIFKHKICVILEEYFPLYRKLIVAILIMIRICTLEIFKWTITILISVVEKQVLNVGIKYSVVKKLDLILDTLFLKHLKFVIICLSFVLFKKKVTF